MLEAMLQAKGGDEEGDLSPSVNDLTTRDPAVSEDVGSEKLGGSGGPRRARRRLRKPRQTQPIEFWHDLFRHINLSGRYPWENADRKILANAARKYSVPALMAMWDLYVKLPGYWFKTTGGTVYGMVRDSERFLDMPDFKNRERNYQRVLLEQYGIYDAILNP